MGLTLQDQQLHVTRTTFKLDRTHATNKYLSSICHRMVSLRKTYYSYFRTSRRRREHKFISSCCLLLSQRYNRHVISLIRRNNFWKQRIDFLATLLEKSLWKSEEGRSQTCKSEKARSQTSKQFDSNQ
ncbi:hypothetical protein YC2023_081609 [Brassica napus]